MSKIDPAHENNIGANDRTSIYYWGEAKSKGSNLYWIDPILFAKKPISIYSQLKQLSLCALIVLRYKRLRCSFYDLSGA